MNISRSHGRIARPTVFFLVFLFCSVTLTTAAWSQTYIPLPDFAAGNELIHFATTVVMPNSAPFPLLSIPLSVNDWTAKPQIRQQNLKSVTFILENLGGLDLSDFLPLTKDGTSGIALYAESGDVPEFFNYAEGDATSDIPLILKSAPAVVRLATGYQITFEPVSVAGSTQLPINSDGFPEFYIVAKTSIELRQGDAFEAYMTPGMISIEDRDPKVGVFRRFDDHFPSETFATNFSTQLGGLAILPEFRQRAIFRGDIVQIYNRTTVGQRIINRSEPTTILAMDLVGAPTEEYFVKEIRVNFLGIDLYPISWLYGPEYLPSNVGPAVLLGMDYINAPTSLGGYYNPYDSFRSLFINTPKFLQNPAWYETFTPPLAVPDQRGLSVFNRQNPNRAKYLADRGMDVPTVVSPEIFLDLLQDGEGGVFLFTEGSGGVEGVYETNVDRRLALGDGARFESLDVTTLPREIINRLLPTALLKSKRTALPRDPITGEVQLSFLLDDVPLDFLLTPRLARLMAEYAQFEVPSGYKINSLVVDAYKVSPRDFSWDTGKYILGLSREMIDALLADAAIESADVNGDFIYDGDGIDNCTELYGRQLISGFTMVLPLSSNNPKELLRIPSSDSVALDTDRPELYIAVKTSDKIRNLHSILPFILPGDITVGKQLERFVRGATDVETLPSYSRVGQPRLGLDRLLPERPGETLTVTNPLIGRPRPQFTFQDLTIPGPGENAANNNIITGPMLGSPPKAVIGINAIDYGQNANLMFNNTSGTDYEAIFFTESTVLDTLTVDFLPAPGESLFNTRIINGVTNAQAIESVLNNLVSEHQIIIYEDDDTPPGDGMDNDGDGMIDEELVNLIDDDGDGLIDEDCGDGDPKGINGVFDPYDAQHDFFLRLDDHIGVVRTPVEGPNIWASAYKRAVNHGLFIPDPLNPEDAGEEITEDLEFSPLVPIGSGAFRAIFDLRVMKIGEMNWGLRDTMLRIELPFSREPDSGFDITSDKDTPVIDLTLPITNAATYLMQASKPALDGKFYLPNWGDIADFDGKILSAIISAAGSETNPKMINLGTIYNKNGTPIGFIGASGSASLRDIRGADPYCIFNRIGLVPLIANDLGTTDGNPQGGSPPSPLYVSQRGWYVTTAEQGQLETYFTEMITTMNDAHEAFLLALEEAINAWNEEVEAYMEEKAEAEDPSSIEPPVFDPDSLPEPTEVTLTDPGDGLGLSSVPANEDMSYEYQLQIPDEEYGPLRGNDYYVVLRAAKTAEVGDRFQVRMGSGAITYLSFTDTNQVYSDRFPGKSTGSVVTSALVVRSANVPPTFKFLSPKAGRNYADEYQQYEISWQATDPDNDATITLYVDSDNKGFDGSLLVAGLTEGVDTRYKMNLVEDIPGFDPALDYYIYASITDGISEPQLIYADGPVALGSTGSPGGGAIPIDPTGDPVDYYKLVSDGRIFNLGEAPGLSDVTALGGTTLAIDMELTADYSGAAVLATDGRVFAIGNVGVFSDKIAADGEIVFPSNPIDNPSSGVTMNSACDLEVDFERGTIFILDMDGDFVVLGTEPSRNLAPTIRLPGVDIYRDMELTPDGEGMYFLTFAGDIYGSGTASGYNRSLGFGQDLARDIEPVIAGNGVSGIIALDAYGRMYGLGADLPPYRPPVSDEPLFRSMAKIAGKERAYLLADGGGHVYAATHEAILMPKDAALFGDEPGMQDDRVVDIESAAYNLRDIPGLINDLLLAYANEDTKSILALTSSDYSDVQGMNRAKLSTSLGNFFDFYHMKSMRVGVAEDALMVTFQGNKVIVAAQVETTYFLPQVNRLVPEVEETQTVYADIQGFPNEGGSEAGFPFSQTVTMREVGDGRGWNLSVYDIDNTMNQSLTEFSWDEFEGAENTTKLQSLIAAPGNRRVEYFGFQSKGPERQRRIKFNYHGPGRLNTFMFWFQQMVYNIYYGPPVMEIIWYQGDIASWQSDAFEIQMENINGKFQITSIRMPQRLRVNTNGSEISANSESEPAPLEDELEVEIPDGFSFTSGSMVVTLQPGDADIVLESAERLAVTNKNQGIMNLGKSIDIFAVSAQELLNSISRFNVMVDNLDTEANSVFSTNVVPGNSYFVILRDGVHFALMRILQRLDLEEGETAEEIYFEWVYRSDFVLPKNF